MTFIEAVGVILELWIPAFLLAALVVAALVLAGSPRVAKNLRNRCIRAAIGALVSLAVFLGYVAYSWWAGGSSRQADGAFFAVLGPIASGFGWTGMLVGALCVRSAELLERSYLPQWSVQWLACPCVGFS